MHMKELMKGACSWILLRCRKMKLVNYTAAFQRSWLVLGMMWHSTHARALQRVRACVIICDGLIVRLS